MTSAFNKNFGTILSKLLVRLTFVLGSSRAEDIASHQASFKLNMPRTISHYVKCSTGTILAFV